MKAVGVFIVGKIEEGKAQGRIRLSCKIVSKCEGEKEGERERESESVCCRRRRRSLVQGGTAHHFNIYLNWYEKMMEEDEEEMGQ